MASYDDEVNKRNLSDISKKSIPEFTSELSPKASRGDKKEVFIIHGYNAWPEKHWFMWLKGKLEEDGIRCEVLRMPDSSKPELSDWLQYISETAGKPDRDTYFVAHSLGCPAILRYLQDISIKPDQTGGLILVSGFKDPIPDLPELDEFTSWELKRDVFIQGVKKRCVISAEDDPIVPFELSEKLAFDISAVLEAFPSGGHFMESEGFTEFPEVYRILKIMMEENENEKESLKHQKTQ